VASGKAAYQLGSLFKNQTAIYALGPLIGHLRPPGWGTVFTCLRRQYGQLSDTCPLWPLSGNGCRAAKFN